MEKQHVQPEAEQFVLFDIIVQISLLIHGSRHWLFCFKAFKRQQGAFEITV